MNKFETVKISDTKTKTFLNGMEVKGVTKFQIARSKAWGPMTLVTMSFWASEVTWKTEKEPK